MKSLDERIRDKLEKAQEREAINRKHQEEKEQEEKSQLAKIYKQLEDCDLQGCEAEYDDWYNHITVAYDGDEFLTLSIVHGYVTANSSEGYKTFKNDEELFDHIAEVIANEIVEREGG